ncbi:Very-long-chain (3R)-3-hydroxyacyl-CoA dehydratase 2 [Pseudolycoriella hygida]|uniref:Very-long-chain (3R)-3-hydroxyacyl-CoA dehydratase n=1 Tax=Pseudolycoriella hygida TaxID=35572 RepID=A0A9Q0RXR4_9DIPT|nr:Very-long-chain (3R)-3-hydroxyacyl-CoA dehydratase 2 [Pseudolycoriella hygida]
MTKSSKETVQKGESGARASREPSMISKLYLILYNGVQTIGWSYILFLLISYYTIRITDVTLWEYLGVPLLIFQNGAILEIIHAAIGIVRSNVLITTFQVFSRVMVVCGVLLATPTAIFSPGLPLALLAWSITEIIRYGFYVLNIIKHVPHFVTFLRYTTFIILYPIGVTGELLCFYWAQSYAKGNTIWTLSLPNAANFTFNYYYFLWIIMLAYIPLFPMMYMHMVSQRKKVLGSGVKCKSS